MTKLSIIVPVYNVENYLEDCLNSLCHQSLKELEIICVNDGSTDKSGKILKRFYKHDKRIIIVEQTNSGLSIARNIGMKYATGEYITFLDSDDWVASDFYEILYNEAKKHDADIAVGNVLYYHNDRQMNFDFVSWHSFADNKKIISDCKDKKFILQSCAVWNKIYKRDLIDKNNLLFYDKKMVEDFPFNFMAIAVAQKIVCCPFAMLYYRQRQTSIMRDPTKQLRNTWDVLDNYNTLLDDLERSKIQNISYFKNQLYFFAIKNLLAWSEKISKKQRKLYVAEMRTFLQKFDCVDITNEAPYWSLLISVMYKDTVNRLLDIGYSVREMVFRLFNVTVFRIVNKNEQKVKFYLFGFLPISMLRCRKHKHTFWWHLFHFKF